MPVDVVSAIVAITGTIKSLREAIDSRQSNAVLLERIALSADRMEFVKDYLSALGAELAAEQAVSEKLRAELLEARAKQRELEAQIEGFRADLKPDPFVERKGLLFKREADDSGYITVCPSCKTALARADDYVVCTRCNFSTQISRGAELSIVKSLMSGEGHG